MIVALLVVSVVVNYIDRSNLGIAAPVLQTQLSLQPIQMGSLLAAFSWTYALLQLGGISGWLTDRFPVGYVLLIGYLLWSLATMATGVLSTFEAIFVARLVLGAGESVAYPCYSRVFAELPQHQRGQANAFIDAGTKLGPSAGALIGGLVMIHYGWRALFLLLGGASLLWVIPWVMVMPRTRAAEADEPKPEASTADIFRVRSAWGTFLGHFCGNYFYYFLLAWLPLYLVQEAKMSLLGMTKFSSAAFFLIAVSTLVAGYISDRLIRKGASVTKVRKTVTTAGLIGSALLGVFVLAPAGSHLSLGILLLSCIGYGTYTSNHWAIIQTLAGTRMAGRWSGLQNGIANLSGIAGPWLAGAIVQRYGSLKLAFIITGVIALVGAFAFSVIVEKVETVKWPSKTATA